MSKVIKYAALAVGSAVGYVAVNAVGKKLKSGKTQTTTIAE